MNWRTGVWILGGPLLGGAVAGLSNGCNRVDAGAPPAPPPPLVTVSVARSADVPVYLDEIGKCSSPEAVTITPQVAGQIMKRHFEDGADLKKGDPLFTIDTRPYQAALDSARAQFAQAKAAKGFADIELQRYNSVANTQAISKSDIDTKRNAVELADAQLAAAQAAIETAQLNLAYCDIRSPLNGRAGARLVDAGNVVKANETALLSVQRLDPIYADFTVTERDLPEVQKQMASHTLSALVRLPVDPDGRAGELKFLDNSVQDGTGTVKLRATVPNADHHFWPGQFVNVKLILATKNDAVLVPAGSTQISQQGPFVYVVAPNGTADLRPVSIGQQQGQDVVLTGGVKAGERVITTGQMTVQPGGPVRIDTTGKQAVGGNQPPGLPTAPNAHAPEGRGQPAAGEGATPPTQASPSTQATLSAPATQPSSRPVSTQPEGGQS